MMATMLVRTRAGSTTRSRRSMVAVAVAASMTLAACGGSDDADDSASADPAPSSVASATAAAPTTTRPRSTTTMPSTTTEPATTTTTRPRATTTTQATTTTTFGPVETILPSTSTTTTRVVAAPAPAAAPAAPKAPINPPTDSYAAEPVIEVGSIVIPKLGVDMTMYEGIRLTTLDYGPGHWPGTAMPGQAGNVVVGGHRTSSHRVFRNIDQLDPGDEIIFRDGAGQHTYRVSRTEIVLPDAVWIVNPTPTPTATLFACNPPGSTRERIVVFADLVG